MLEQDVLGGEAERTAKARRRQDDTLRRVANGDNPVFAELAREVRAGRMLLMEVATSDAYRDPPGQGRRPDGGEPGSSGSRP